MSLVKISQVMVCIAISLVLIVFWLHSKQHKVWLVYLASFCSAFLSFWLLADREIKNIPDFIHSVLVVYQRVSIRTWCAFGSQILLGSSHFIFVNNFISSD